MNILSDLYLIKVATSSMSLCIANFNIAYLTHLATCRYAHLHPMNINYDKCGYSVCVGAPLQCCHSRDGLCDFVHQLMQHRK